MTQRSATAPAAIGFVTVVWLCAPACAHAEPPQPQPATPQRDAACSEALVGVMTRLADGQTNLVCTNEGGDLRWSAFNSPYPVSDRWLTYGPELSLHGQGLRNPEIMSGRWSGEPQEPDGVCTAEQVTVLGPGRVSPPVNVAGEPGKRLEFSVSPTLFTIKLSGNCVWQRA